MNKKAKLELSRNRIKRVKYCINTDTKQEANQIANAIKKNKCEIVKISKGIVRIHKIENGRMEVVVPPQISMRRLLFYLKRLLRDRKKVKIETIDHRIALKGKKVSRCICNTPPKNIYIYIYYIRSKKDGDDGSGTGPRVGIKQKDRPFMCSIHIL